MKAFAAPKGKGKGKYFHLQSAIVSSKIYPDRAVAFKDAADMIIDRHQSAKQFGHGDRLLFPVTYLYRHYLELQLKDLVVLAVRCKFYLLSEVEEILSKHELCPLWTKTKRYLLARDAKENKTPDPR